MFHHFTAISPCSRVGRAFGSIITRSRIHTCVAPLQSRHGQHAHSGDHHTAVKLAFNHYAPPAHHQTTTNSINNNVPLLLIHGLYGSKRNWASIGKALAHDPTAPRHVFTLDLRNHGESPHSDTMSYSAMVSDVLRFMDDRGVSQPPVMLGHSMGGKVVMTLAMEHPDRIAAPIIADMAPFDFLALPEVSELRAIVAAMQKVDLAQATSPSEVEDQLKPTIPNTAVRKFIMTNLAPTHSEHGPRFRWLANIDVIARDFPQLAAFPHAPGLIYDGRAYFLAGSKARYVTLPAAIDAIHDLFPNNTIEYLDAGHWLHAEATTAFLAKVRGYLSAVDAREKSTLSF